MIKRFLLIALCCILGACSGPDGAKPSSNKNVLTLNMGGEPTYLNPLLYTDSPSSTVVGLVFRGLMKVNQNLDMVPDLASSYFISQDGLTYTFNLRRGVKWHDGEDFTADDVVFTFKTLLDPSTNTVRRSSYMINGNPIDVKKRDENTIIITLPEPFAPFLVSMGMGILPEHVLNGKDINTDSFNRAPIGTGPFKFVRWESNQYVMLEKNELYYGKPPKLDSILLKIIPDKNTALVALEKSEIDLEDGLLPKDYERVSTNRNLWTYRHQEMAYTYMGFNLQHPLLGEKKIREAISYALNRDAMVKSVLGEFGQPAYMPASPVQWSWPGKSSVTIYEYAPEKTMAILEELGYRRSTATGLYYNGQGELAFTLVTNKGNKNREKAAQIIQQSLKQVGIKVTIELLEWSAFIKRLNQSTGPRGLEAYIIGWSLGIDPDAYSIWHSSQYPTGFNYIGDRNSTVDSLLEEGRTETNKVKRKGIYRQIYQEITEDIPYYFLYHADVIGASHTYVGGLMKNPGPLGVIDDIEDVYLKPTLMR
ncbi:MAG: peptide-binding protein [bacterium]|nr:peptide-binding protein [bacterium]